MYHPATSALSGRARVIDVELVNQANQVQLALSPSASVRVAGVVGGVTSAASTSSAVSIVLVNAFQALSIQDIVRVSHRAFGVV